MSNCSLTSVWTRGHLSYTLAWGPALFDLVAKIVPVGSVFLVKPTSLYGYFFVCDFNIFVATKCSRLIFFFFKTLLNFCCNITPVLCFGCFGPEACHTIASQPGTEPTPPALEGKVLTTRPAGKFPQAHLIRSCPSPRISNFSEELWICWLENGIRNQNQGMRFVLASQSLCFLVLSADRMLLNMS